MGEVVTGRIRSIEQALGGRMAVNDSVIEDRPLVNPDKAGPTGPKGDQGDPGQSAYETWLGLGYVGAESDFIAALRGATGLTGAQGPKGDKGDTGLTGPQGDKGDKGDKGDTGLQGIQGVKGDKGDKGDTGLQGIQGIQGIQGVTGAAGAGGAADLQNGVTASGDCALSAVSVASVTGVITYTLAAGSVFVTSVGGVVTAVSFAGVSGATLTPGALPATGKYRGYGIEMDTSGALSLSTGGTDQTTLALALTNINTGPAAGKLRIADVVLLNTAGAYSNAATRDRRPWARGGFNRIVRTSNAGAGNDYTTTSNVMAAIDATNLSVRMECSGVPVRVSLACRAVAPAGGMNMAFFMDGVAADGYTGPVYLPASQSVNEAPWQVIVPSAGSRLFQPAISSVTNGQTSTITVGYGGAVPVQFTVEEIVRQNANNGTS